MAACYYRHNGKQRRVSEPSTLPQYSCIFQPGKERYFSNGCLRGDAAQSGGRPASVCERQREVNAGNTYVDLLASLGWKRVSLKTTTAGKRDSFVPSPVEGRLPLARATDGTRDGG